MKECDCELYEKNIKEINGCINFSTIHGVSYKGVFFKYCPWCGRKLEEVNEWKPFIELSSDTYPKKEQYYTVREVLLQMRYEEPITLISRNYWNGERWIDSNNFDKHPRIIEYREDKI